MAALVTGASGFLGRKFTAALRHDGWDVWALDIREGPQVSVDDARDFFCRAFNPPRFDLVVHCAAMVGGRAQIEGDPLSLAVNLELDAALFGWARLARPGRILYISSSAVYPVALQDGRNPVPLHEEDQHLNDPRRPDELYGWVKLTGEILAREARAAGVPVTVVRPFSGYGEDQDDSYPFPKMVARAVNREDPFDVWGSGRQVRDFIHVSDIVAGSLALCARGCDGPVNLGSGHPVSMIDLAGWVCAAAGYEPGIRIEPGKPSGVRYRVADTRRMKQLLGEDFPRVTLAEGIKRALAGQKVST